MVHINSTVSYQEQKELGKIDSFRLKVYNTIANSPFGLTDRQVMYNLRESDFNNIRPEITRLKQDGLVGEIGKTKCFYTGKMVRVVVVLLDKPYFTRGNKK